MKSARVTHRLAISPVCWGISDVPGWGHQLDPERVLSEAAAVGEGAITAGPPGFLPDRSDQARPLPCPRMALLLGDAGRLRPLYVLLDDAAIEEVDGAVGVAGEAGIVRDHADRRALPVQVAQELHHGVAVLGIEVPGRLVGEQDERIAGERASYRHALLLPTR